MLSRISALFSIAILAILAGESRGAIIAYASGNTNPGENLPANTIDGTVNFAVFDRNGGTVGDSFGSGIADSVIDSMFGAGASQSSFLYLYQAVNDGETAHQIGRVTVYSYAPITGFGVLQGYGLQDGGGLVSSSNPFGPSSSYGNPDGVTLGVPDGAVGTITDGNGGLNADYAIYTGNPGSPGQLGLNFSTFLSFGEGPLLNGQRSDIFGMTSNYGPGIVMASLIGSSANGHAVGPTDGLNGAPPVLPEPASLTLWALGFALCGGVGYAKNRQKSQAA